MTVLDVFALIVLIVLVAAASSESEDSALSISMMPSARVKSMRPFKKARLVNSPGSASRAPA